MAITQIQKRKDKSVTGDSSPPCRSEEGDFSPIQVKTSEKNPDTPKPPETTPLGFVRTRKNALDGDCAVSTSKSGFVWTKVYSGALSKCVIIEEAFNKIGLKIEK
jgi:hypothetical protein